MTWTTYPTAAGWWFFTAELKDWRQSLPIQVEKTDRGTGVFYTTPAFGGKRVTPGAGFWFGPVLPEDPYAGRHEDRAGLRGTD